MSCKPSPTRMCPSRRLTVIKAGRAGSRWVTWRVIVQVKDTSTFRYAIVLTYSSTRAPAYFQLLDFVLCFLQKRGGGWGVGSKEVIPKATTPSCITSITVYSTYRGLLGRPWGCRRSTTSYYIMPLLIAGAEYRIASPFQSWVPQLKRGLFLRVLTSLSPMLTAEDSPS